MGYRTAAVAATNLTRLPGSRMEAMQPLLLASGVFAGFLLGVGGMRVRERRSLEREASRLATQVRAGAMPGSTATPQLLPLLDACRHCIESLQEAREARDAQQRQLSSELVRAMQQADGAVRAKERFLAASNHDLRQPLQAMDLALVRLRQHAVDAQEGALYAMQDGIQTMAEVLDGLLLLSQLDANAVHAEPAACDLRELLADTAAAQRPRADAAGIRLHVHCGALAVLADPGLLAGLLGRVLDNALDATPAGGGVLLAARARGDRIRIEVRDSGVGIAPVHQPRVFDEFFQVGNPERDHRKGFGLGLAIASRIATLLGTRIELRSRLHGGSCFWLDLPRAVAGRRLTHVLLLGDADDTLAALLRSWGHAVAGADGDGASGGMGERVDAILCTFAGTPGDHALHAFEQATARHPSATRIVVAGVASADLLQLAARRGASLLLRPLPPSKLRALLAQRPSQASIRGAA